MASKIEALRREVSLFDVVTRYGTKLVADGAEFIGCCPLHQEDTPSFTVFTGRDKVERFQCFGCGERGDVVDFVMAIKGVDIKEAFSVLEGSSSRDNIKPADRPPPRDIYAGITPLDPPAERLYAGRKVKLYNPKRAGTDREWGSFSPTMVFPYRKADGSLLGYVLRHNLPGGDKETPMVMWVRLPDGLECWSRFPFPGPRPLYGLPDIGDSRQVIVVEGEKCRDQLAKTTGRTVVSWPGGTYGVEHTDWSPLAGRNIIIWPDADKPGIRTADKIAAKVSALEATARVLSIQGYSQ